MNPGRQQQWKRREKVEEHVGCIRKRSSRLEEVTASRHKIWIGSDPFSCHYPGCLSVSCCVCVCVCWVLEPFRGDGGRKTEVNFSCNGISLCQAKWALIGGTYGPAQVGFSTRTHTHTLTQSPHCHLLSSELSTKLLISAFPALATFLFCACVCFSSCPHRNPYVWVRLTHFNDCVCMVELKILGKWLCMKISNTQRRVNVYVHVWMLEAGFSDSSAALWSFSFGKSFTFSEPLSSLTQRNCFY